MKRFTVLILTLLTFTILTPSALADGIIIPYPPICVGCPVPPPPPRQTPYLTVQNHRVNVTIKEQIATTHVDQTFRNDSQWALEGTYIFPLPESAAISDFSMWVNGERVEGKLYTKEEARRIYDDIVRRRLDPALLEYVGRDLFQASIFPIQPGDTRRVEIEYNQILPVDNGLVQYVYPLSTERFSAKPLENVSITVDIESKEAIKTIYAASHAVSINREGGFRAKVGWEDANVLPDKDFSLYYTISSAEVGVNLLSYQERNEDGFFVLFVSPNVETEQSQVVAKDVILVLDTSGSMEGEKMEQARGALKFVLDHLNQNDRFNVIAFSTGVHDFSANMEVLSKLDEARRFVDGLKAGGSTDINCALLEAVKTANSDRPTIVIFLTDGLPTSGVVEKSAILNNIKQAASKNLRIFPFGVGDDVDTFLLDSLAQELRGTTAYIRPGERIDEQISAFYAKVSTPVLADLSLDVSGVTIDDTYPAPLPDLFVGSQLILTGRYRNGGSATVTLTGQVNGQPRTFRFNNLSFASSLGEKKADFIPRLWATRKIGYLLNQIRLNGENKEAIDEIVNLSVRYGIVTPYTSFLVKEPEMALSEEGRGRIAQDEYDRAEAAPPAPASGGGAVNKAVEQQKLSNTDMAAPTSARGGNGAAVSPGAVTVVGNKAFVLKDGVWTDTTFDSTRLTATKLPFPSDMFFEFLSNYPEAGKYFALGSRVVVLIDGVAYETVEGDTLPEPLPANNTPTAIPTATMPVEPSATATMPSATSTPQASANSAETQLVLKADVVVGTVPLEVNFTGELIGGADDSRAYYCAPFNFDFGDGVANGTTPRCRQWQAGVKIQRKFSANYIYSKAGVYQATFELNNVKSSPLTISVNEANRQPDQATPTAPTSSSVSPTATSSTPTASAKSPTKQGNLIYLMVGIFLLLGGVALGWWSRGR